MLFRAILLYSTELSTQAETLRSRLSVTLRAAFGNQLILPPTTFLDLARTLRAPDRPCAGAWRTPCARPCAPCATVAVWVVPGTGVIIRFGCCPVMFSLGGCRFSACRAICNMLKNLLHFHTEHVFVENVGCVKCPEMLQKQTVFRRCMVATILKLLKTAQSF